MKKGGVLHLFQPKDKNILKPKKNNNTWIYIL